MKMPIVLGNWKANKTIAQARQWIAWFSSHKGQLPIGASVILCPSFHHIPLFVEAGLPMSLGVQDISEFSSGAYTGEVSGDMVSDMVSYTMLGHSERRKYYHETDEIVAEKVTRAIESHLAPIVCVSELSHVTTLKALIPDFSSRGMLLYEPLSAVGSGKPDTPERANNMAKEMMHVMSDVRILYGGSVVPENVRAFVSEEYLAGVVVGGASLDPEKFLLLIKRALES